tara:strand:+ start:28327 stop:29238 length:912 start_codon:yes stop_codon:yes gene_type:complete
MIQDPISEQEIDFHRVQNERIFTKSRYKFLMGHNGIRPASLSGLMGTTGCGKTSLVKCIMTETATQHKILIWLSEESVKEYQDLIGYLDKDALKNITFVEEGDIPEEIMRSQSDFLEYFTQMGETGEYGTIFIDNVTTSAFYNSRYGIAGQNRSAEFLRNYPKKTGTHIFYIAHTRSEVTDNYGRVVAPEDIRGSKELPMTTAFFYIIQKFTTNEKQYNFLRVAKYRGYEKAAGWFALIYERKSYTKDNSVPFTVVNKIFRNRDYFGRTDRAEKISNKDLKEKPKEETEDLEKKIEEKSQDVK